MKPKASKIIGGLISLSALTGAFWYSVTPHAAKFCTGDSYSVVRQNNSGEDVTLEFNSQARFQFCSHVAANSVAN